LYDDYQEYFYRRLGKLRTEKGVSAMKMSKMLGQEGSYIGKVENKSFLPTMSVFFYICEYLETTPRDFFDSDIQFPANINQLFRDLKTFDKDELECIENIVAIIKKSKNKTGD